jgi:transposase
MNADDASLPDDLATAHLQLREQAETLRRQGVLIAKLQHQLEQLLRQKFGKKGEAIDPAQLLLFAPEVAEPPAPGPTPGAKPTPPTPRDGGRKPLPASLPRKRIVHDVAPDDRACPECGLERRKIGEETREQLEYVPASLVVLEHVRPKYACKCCEAHVVIAPRLPEPIEKGLPGTGLLAHVVTSKLVDHLPLYRQEGIFKRFGVELSRSTMCGWMAAAAGLLEPIVKAMLKRVLLSVVFRPTTRPSRCRTTMVRGSRPDGSGSTSATGTTASLFMTTHPTVAVPGPSGSSRASRATSRPTLIRRMTRCS